MKKLLLLGVCAFGINVLLAQQTYTISISGFTFSPAEVTVEIGDTVFFNGSNLHPVLEVSQETWNANETTALPGGFSFPSGVGKIAFDAAGTHYYVCTNHASLGMKGTINVTEPSSVKTITGSVGFSLYPVPLTGSNLNIRFNDNTNENVDISVYNIIGMELLQLKNQPVSQGLMLDCSQLAKGAYLLQIKQGEHYSTARFIRR